MWNWYLMQPRLISCSPSITHPLVLLIYLCVCTRDLAALHCAWFFFLFFLFSLQTPLLSRFAWCCSCSFSPTTPQDVKARYKKSFVILGRHTDFFTEERSDTKWKERFGISFLNNLIVNWNPNAKPCWQLQQTNRLLSSVRILESC